MAGGSIKDFAEGTLTAGIAAGATSLTVGSGAGAAGWKQINIYGHD
jgi:hypothetical protein